MKAKKRILLLGGGTGGHIMPLVPFVRALKERGIERKVILSDAPLDRDMAEKNLKGEEVVFFRTGKIRRYVSWKNIPDFFRIIGSFWRARRLLNEYEPDVLFMKGGFVCFPFLVAARFLVQRKMKIYLHESDSAKSIMHRWFPGWFDGIFSSFGHADSTPLFTSPQTPLLPFELEERDTTKPLLFLFGGSLGAVFLNTLLFENIDIVLKKYDVVVISGRGKKNGMKRDGLWEYELLSEQMFHGVLRASDLVISRAGANSLLEIMNAKKPALIVPLPSSSHDHQRENARFFSEKDLCVYKEQSALKQMTGDEFVLLLDMIYEDEYMKNALRESDFSSMEKALVDQIVF